MIALSIALLIAAAQPAKAADCEAAERDRPTLDVKRIPGAKFKLVTTVIGQDNSGGRPVALTLRHGVETAVLKRGARLRVTLGGCESFGNEYAFTLADSTSLSDGRHWFETAAALMAEVQAVSHKQPLDLDWVRSDLRAQAKRRPGFSFAGHDFMPREEGALEENYLLKVKHTTSGAVLSLSVFHAL